MRRIAINLCTLEMGCPATCHAMTDPITAFSGETDLIRVRACNLTPQKCPYQEVMENREPLGNRFAIALGRQPLIYESMEQITDETCITRILSEIYEKYGEQTQWGNTSDWYITTAGKDSKIYRNKHWNQDVQVTLEADHTTLKIVFLEDLPF